MNYNLGIFYQIVNQSIRKPTPENTHNYYYVICHIFIVCIITHFYNVVFNPLGLMKFIQQDSKKIFSLKEERKGVIK